LVVSANGVNHEELVKAIERSGLAVPQNNAGVELELSQYEPLPQVENPSQNPVFSHGESLVQGSLDTTVGLAFQGVSIGNPNAYKLSLIRNLLQHKLGSCAYNIPYTDNGLFAIVGETSKDYSTSPGSTLLNNLVRGLKNAMSFSPEELELAKNLTKLSIARLNECSFSSIESSAVRSFAGAAVPDVSAELSWIDKITADEVRKTMESTFSTKPALVVVGDTNGIPHF